MTFITCKKVILNRLKNGTLDVNSMKDKLDVFLLAERIPLLSRKMKFLGAGSRDVLCSHQLKMLNEFDDWLRLL